jgi:hypothetical protein
MIWRPISRACVEVVGSKGSWRKLITVLPSGGLMIVASTWCCALGDSDMAISL